MTSAVTAAALASPELAAQVQTPKVEDTPAAGQAFQSHMAESQPTAKPESAADAALNPQVDEVAKTTPNLNDLNAHRVGAEPWQKAIAEKLSENYPQMKGAFQSIEKPGDMLLMQMMVMDIGMRVELASKVVEHTAAGTKTVLQTQT